MASIIPYSLMYDLAVGNVDLDTHTFKLMELTSSYTPNKAHSKRSDLTNEVSGSGYTAGGEAITFTVTRSNGLTSATPATVSWPTANSFTGRYCACYRARGGAASADELVFIGDHGDKTANGLNYQVSFTSAIVLEVP